MAKETKKQIKAQLINEVSANINTMLSIGRIFGAMFI